MNRVCLLVIVIILSACTAVDPYSGEQKTSNTAKGAGAGAIAGAILGAATASKKDRGKGALTGAVVGGAVGGGVGYYMDKQEAALRQKLQGSGVQVRREGENIRLLMPGNITFATGRHELKGSFYSTLDSVALVLNEFNKTAIKVAGHTDSTGDALRNQTLSEQRADSVGRYLISQRVLAGRVQVSGFGERYPLQSNQSVEGRQANRRVELELLPL